MGLRLPKSKGMLRREAASWLARLQSGRDPGVERKFERWRNADPRHAEAFGRVRRSYEQAGLLRHSPIVASAGCERASARPRWQARPALAAAVAAVLLVPVGVSLVRAGDFPFLGARTVMLMTAVGEIREVSLADGSKVTLDTSTRLEVKIGRSRRSAHLEYGHARFQIAEAGQPFLVDTANSAVTARQGVIDVEQGARQDRVEVLAGAAEVRGADQEGAPPTGLAAGESVTVTPEGAGPKAPVPSAPDWTRGMLQFDATPIADATALANRYSKRQIILVGDFRALRITGAFRAGDSTGLARALAAAFGLTLQQSADGNLLLSRSAPPALRKKKGG